MRKIINLVKQKQEYLMASNLSDLLLKLNNTTNNKIGSTTTVNEQVDELQGNLSQFKSLLDKQQKQQSELQFQLKKFQESTKTNLQQMNKEFSDRIEYLTNLFKSTSDQQNSQFEYMEHQNKTLHEEHDKMNEIGSVSNARTESLENAIGI